MSSLLHPLLQHRLGPDPETFIYMTNFAKGIQICGAKRTILQDLFAVKSGHNSPCYCFCLCRGLAAIHR